MTTIIKRRELKTDGRGKAIQAGSKIVAVLEVSITAAGFVAVSLSSTQFCKAIFVGTRDNSNWLLSDVSAGTTYKTMRSDTGINIVGSASETLFYVKGTTTTTLEVILLD